MKQDIILAGVGGQGILSIAYVIDNAALADGLAFKQAEVHGMAQRGGAVQSHMRLSDGTIWSDLIPKGEADMILSVEPLEALRYFDYPPAGRDRHHELDALPEHPRLSRRRQGPRGRPQGAAQRRRRFREAGQGGRHGQGPEHRPPRGGRVVPDPQGGEPSQDDRRPLPRPGPARSRGQPQGLRARQESGPRLMKTAWARTIRVLEEAEKDGRNFLLEPEVYEVLKDAGIPTPRHVFVPAGKAGRTPGPRRAGRGRGRRQDRLAARHPQVRRRRRRLRQGRPGRGEQGLRGHAADGRLPHPRRREKGRPGVHSRLSPRREGRFDNVGFGSEILLGLRNSQDFGPVLTMGSGGLDVEYMNARLKEGRAVAIASAHLLDEAKAQELIEPLTFYGKLAAEFRGRKPLVSPQVLVETLLRFRDLAAAFSAFDPATPFVLEEAEVNPFVVRRGRLVPLDGVCRFSRAQGGRRPPGRSRPSAGCSSRRRSASSASRRR